MANSGSEANHEVSSDMIREVVDITSCEPCIRNHISSPATIFCKTCKELICDSCTHYHIIYKPGKHDTVVLGNSASAPVVVNMKGMDKCLEHCKKIKYFCQDHAMLCCNTCAFKHRKCDNVNELAGLSGQEGTELQDLQKTLLKLETMIGSIKTGSKLSQERLNETITNLQKQIDDTRDRIIKMFYKAKKTLIEDADNFKAEEMTRLSEINKTSSRLYEDIKEILPICSALVEHGTSQQKYIIFKTITEKINNIKTHINEQRIKHITLKVSLNFPTEVSSLLADEEDIVKLNVERHLAHKVIKPVALRLLVSIDLKQGGDDEKEPFITGLDFLPDGRMVAVDCSNCKCIIMDDRLQRQGTPYKFNANPLDVACLSLCEIAVTMSNKTVCLLSVNSDNTISLIREIHTSTKVDSICCMTPTHMVVSTYDDPRSARIITKDGVELDFDQVVFRKKSYTPDESICTYVRSKNTLVLTDRFDNTVYMYDTVKGTCIPVTDEIICEPMGVCVGLADTVLVCSVRKNSIVHLTAFGGILGTYPVETKFPYSLCMNKDENILAVSNSALGKRKLLLYKLS